MTDVASLAGRLAATARATGSPERAAGTKRYLKSDLDFYGTAVGDLRGAVRGLLRERPLERAELVALAERLWAGGTVFECRLLAALLLAAGHARLELADLALVGRLVRDSNTWALVDPLACDVAGPVTDRLDRTAGPAANPTPVLDRWAADGDFWLRRSALLAHERPLRAGGGDWGRFTRYADLMLGEQEFFVRKAIGWVLRDTGRRRPDLVYDWLLPRTSRAAGLTVREAVKYLSPDRRAEILAVMARARAARPSRARTGSARAPAR